MGFWVEGDYFETCNCDVSCNCVWLGTATQENCDVFLAWHVTKGNKDGIDLSGLNAVMAVHAPKRMTDGGWKVALYLDDRASPEQSEALGAVFSGGAGGYLAGLWPLIGEVAGVEPTSITFQKSDGSLYAPAAGALSIRGVPPKIALGPRFSVGRPRGARGRAGRVRAGGRPPACADPPEAAHGPAVDRGRRPRGDRVGRHAGARPQHG